MLLNCILVLSFIFLLSTKAINVKGIAWNSKYSEIHACKGKLLASEEIEIASITRILLFAQGEQFLLFVIF